MKIAECTRIGKILLSWIWRMCNLVVLVVFSVYILAWFLATKMPPGSFSIGLFAFIYIVALGGWSFKIMDIKSKDFKIRGDNQDKVNADILRANKDNLLFRKGKK